MKWEGLKIKQLASEKGISLQKLANLIGVSRQTVFDWIKGQIPKGNHLILLCKIFQVKPDSLFFDNTRDFISVPVHRTRKGAKITPEMQQEAILLAKKYTNFFKNYKSSEIVPIVRIKSKSIGTARSIANMLRYRSGIEVDKPIDYEHTFKLANELGIYLIFRDFPDSIKGYAYFTKIHNHRVVFVNNYTKIIDLIFPLLHEFVHAIEEKDDIESNIIYKPEEEEFYDNVANFIQFPEEYVKMVCDLIKNESPGQQINILKKLGKTYAHSLHGIVMAIKQISPTFSLDVGGADTNLRKVFPTVGELLFEDQDLRKYVLRLKNLSKNLIYSIFEQIDNITDRKLADLLGIESALDAREVKLEIKNSFSA